MTETTQTIEIKPPPKKPWRWPWVARKRYEADLAYAAAAYKKRTLEATHLRVLWGLVPPKARRVAEKELARIRRKNGAKPAAVAK